MDLEYRGMLWSPTVLVVRLVALVHRLTINLSLWANALFAKIDVLAI